jgi:hypothetical protein
MFGASSEEVGELLSIADEGLIREVVATGATVDEIGEALSDLESGDMRIPRSERVAQVRKLLAPLYDGRGDHGTTFSVIGVPI